MPYFPFFLSCKTFIIRSWRLVEARVVSVIGRWAVAMRGLRQDRRVDPWPDALERASGVAEVARHGGPHETVADKNQHLRLLLVEDTDDDAELLLLELRRTGYLPDVTRVVCQAAFVAALQAGEWDVIVSDHTLPGYGGMAALADLKASGLDIPFILISGTIGERVAVEAMRAGAQDYVLKQDLIRLPVAIARELREKEIRANQVKMREQLMISERMASAGMLAAGVAHEINNPLAAAVSNVDFAALSVRDSVQDLRALFGSEVLKGWDGGARLDQVLDALRDTAESLKRIRDIVLDVKLFSRPLDNKSGCCDLRKVCDSSARMAWNEVRHRARLVKDYGDVPAIYGNESRVGQVILNLIVNAAQAMREGHAADNEIRIGTSTDEAGWAVVTVRDTGDGIPAQNLETIFEPFFTTKPVGIGTGLGLAVCRRIVHELGGTIGVESAVGVGSTFRVAFPPYRQSILPRASRQSAAPTAGRPARVLFVDDEAIMGPAMQRMLSRYHDVIFVQRAGEALERLSRGEHFDVILSDFMMPDMGGREMHQRIAQIDPDLALRVIFLTGGAFSAEGRQYLDGVPNRVLMKPCALSDLLSAIHDVSS